MNRPREAKFNELQRSAEISGQHASEYICVLMSQIHRNPVLYLLEMADGNQSFVNGRME